MRSVVYECKWFCRIVKKFHSLEVKFHSASEIYRGRTGGGSCPWYYLYLFDINELNFITTSIWKQLVWCNPPAVQLLPNRTIKRVKIVPHTVFLPIWRCSFQYEWVHEQEENLYLQEYIFLRIYIHKNTTIGEKKSCVKKIKSA